MNNPNALIRVGGIRLKRKELSLQSPETGSTKKALLAAPLRAPLVSERNCHLTKLAASGPRYYHRPLGVVSARSTPEIGDQLPHGHRGATASRVGTPCRLPSRASCIYPILHITATHSLRANTLLPVRRATGECTRHVAALAFLGRKLGFGFGSWGSNRRPLMQLGRTSNSSASYPCSAMLYLTANLCICNGDGRKLLSEQC